MRYFKVRNLEKFQHYKNRTPPWIKLYNGLLTDYHFMQLRDDAKFHYIAIGLLASRCENKMLYDCKHIADLLHANMPVNLEQMQALDLIQLTEDDSDTLATCPQGAIPEGERETEGELREDSELVNSEQAPQLDIEALGKQMGVQSVTANLEESESFGNFAATLQTHFGKQGKVWVAAAKSWAGKTWNYQLRPKDKPKDRDSENFREWNNKRLKLRHRLLRVIMEIQTEGRPFQFDTANAKLHDPNNSELQARSDAHKRELEV